MRLMTYEKDIIEHETKELCNKVLETVDLFIEFAKTTESRTFYCKQRADF